MELKGRELKVKLTGTSPLLMHSDKLANPLDDLTKAHKALTNKKKKTDDDHIAIAKSEWMASLYLGADGPIIPGQNVKGMLVEAGVLKRQATAFKRALEVFEDEVPLHYRGPKDAEAMYQDPEFRDVRSVVVSGKRIMRYRPCFKRWSLTATLVYFEDMINESDLLAALADGGQYIGLGDFRPNNGGKFGRFTFEVL